jgi:hypothetical protein
MTDKQAMFEELLNLFSFTQEQAERVMSEPVEVATVEQYVDVTYEHSGRLYEHSGRLYEHSGRLIGGMFDDYPTDH